jgi:hypothetical protein
MNEQANRAGSTSTRLPAGTWLVGRKWFGECGYCGSVVRLGKPIVGGLHLCLDEADRREIDRRRAPYRRIAAPPEAFRRKRG